MARPSSEQELAAPVVAWLEAQGWDVYQEVGAGYGIADIVAVLPAEQPSARRVWVIECKTSFGFKVLEQAARWKPVAHWVSVAVPARKSGDFDLSRFEDRVLAWAGVGLISVAHDHARYEYGLGVRERVPAPLCRLADRRQKWGGDGRPSKLLDQLRPEHKQFAKAGSATGGRWTHWKSTAREAQKFIRKHPGCGVKELVDGIAHHYANASSARACLAQQALSGILQGVRAEKTEEGLKLYVEERAA